MELLDSLGRKRKSTFRLYEDTKWYKLSHLDANEEKLELISTYKLVSNELPKDIEKNSHFY